jgi:uncharacterized surface protein with fasciclin (FAS1) repeats
MRMMRLLAIALLLSTIATPQIFAQQQPAKDVIDTAIDAGMFKTLVKAIQEAGMAATLKGQGPFTVFAPTDEAFAKLPPGTLDTLMQDKQKLSALLAAHVVSGRLLAADVAKMQSAKTVNGQEVTFTVKDGVPMVNNAKIIKADVLASNGVIQVIDTVIQPKQ